MFEFILFYFGGDLWWFAVICDCLWSFVVVWGGLLWFAMVCGGLSYIHTACFSKLCMPSVAMFSRDNSKVLLFLLSE